MYETKHLTAMFTDIKGFTAKTSASTRQDLVNLVKKHQELVLPIVKKYGGKLIKTIGDAFLLTFESPTNSVLCGIKIQDELRDYSSKVPEIERIEIRIAINSGEVSVVEGDVYGETVNIASRIQGIAEPGEVFFTEAVYLAMNKQEVPSSEVGYRHLKGIPQKIKVYKVLREPEPKKDEPNGISDQLVNDITKIVDDVSDDHRDKDDIIDKIEKDDKKEARFKLKFDTQKIKEKLSPKRDLDIQEDKETKFAGFWLRVAAIFIDIIAFAILIYSPLDYLLPLDKISPDAEETKELEPPEPPDFPGKPEKWKKMEKKFKKSKTDDSSEESDKIEIETETGETYTKTEENGEVIIKKKKVTKKGKSSKTEKTEKKESIIDIEGDKGEKIVIGDDGISIKGDDGEMVEISNEGITIKSKDGVIEKFKKKDGSKKSKIFVKGESKSGSGAIKVLLWVIYTTVFVFLWGATLGKLAVGLRVVSEDSMVEKPKFPFALLRSVFFFISFAFFLGFLWSIWDKKHRTWHDRVAGTVVIKV
jgi:class 3 adenylate cyclase